MTTVLVCESEAHLSDSVVRELQRGGQRVIRCLDPDLPALCPVLFGHPCPVRDPGVQSAVRVTNDPGQPLTARERPVNCATAAGVPVITRAP